MTITDTNGATAYDLSVRGESILGYPSACARRSSASCGRRAKRFTPIGEVKRAIRGLGGELIELRSAAFVMRERSARHEGRPGVFDDATGKPQQPMPAVSTVPIRAPIGQDLAANTRVPLAPRP